MITMVRQRNDNWNNTDGRLNDLENEVVGMNAKLENIKDDVGGLIVSFNAFTEKSNNLNKTDWATIASWVGVAFVAISAMLYHNKLTLAPIELQNAFQEKTIGQLETQVNQLQQNGKTNPPVQGN
jgi:chromosome segregation ATPase